MTALTTGTNNVLAISGLHDALQLADFMSKARTLPQHLLNQPGDCLMVIEQAVRWQMSPFAVAQCTSVIQGKLMFEGKLVAAAIQASGVLDGRLSYEFSGKGDTLQVVCSGKIKGETSVRDVTLTFKDAKTTNNMWTKQPEQQLVYASTRVWARRHTPEVMLGVYAPEEFEVPAAEPSSSVSRDITPARQTIEHQPTREREVDHLALITGKLERCNSTSDCNAVWQAWERAVEASGKTDRPIAAELAQRVSDLIADRLADVGKKEFAEMQAQNADTLETLPA